MLETIFSSVFAIAVVVAGVTEYLKNFLPEKVKSSNKVLAVIAGLISTGAGIAFSLYKGFSVPTTIIYVIVMIGVVQTCYNVLIQTFKAVVAKLKAKYTVSTETDTDVIADKIVDKVTKLTEEALTEAATEITEATKTTGKKQRAKS